MVVVGRGLIESDPSPVQSMQRAQWQGKAGQGRAKWQGLTGEGLPDLIASTYPT